MTVIVVLLIAGLVLLFFEVILPGGVLGLLAALCFLGATAAGVQMYGFATGGAIFVAAAILSAMTFYLQYRLMSDKFALRDKITGRSRPEIDEKSLVGAKAETLTRLNPSGKIAIDGRTYEAFSQDGYMEKGESVTVLSRDNYRLIIKKS